MGTLPKRITSPARICTKEQLHLFAGLRLTRWAPCQRGSPNLQEDAQEGICFEWLPLIDMVVLSQHHD
jgi:hypothetical protein